MQQNVIHHTAQGVLGALVRNGILQGFTDRHPQAARRIRILGQGISPCLGIHARTRHDSGPPGFHHDPAIGLLVVTDPDHVDLTFQIKDTAGEG